MKHFQYLKYVVRHKWFVFLEAIRLKIFWRGITHDLSKFLPSEWNPYVWSFYGPWSYENRPEWLKQSFDLAWLKHQHRNKHHWQYWNLVNDSEETRILPMPDKYRREMLADWIGAGKAQGFSDTKKWYEKNKANIILHPETRKWIEQQLI